MHITKLGHCCLLIEDKEVQLLTDPGVFSTTQNDLKGLDAVLITHEHSDHLHIDSLKEVLKNNPQATVITNQEVAKQLDQAGISYTLLPRTQKLDVKGLVVEAFDAPHAPIYKTIPPVLNTGFFIADKLFYPGDAFINPNRPVLLLALPVAGPWLTISQAVEYALELKPEKAFPVHDGILKRPTMMHGLFEAVLGASGISFTSLNDGDSYEL